MAREDTQPRNQMRQADFAQWLSQNMNRVQKGQDPNRVKAIQGHQRMAQTGRLDDDMEFIQQRRGQNPPQQVAGSLRKRVQSGLGNQSKDFMTQGIQGIQDIQRKNREALEKNRERPPTVDIQTEEEVVGSMLPDDKEEHIEKVTRLAIWENLLGRALGPDVENKISNVSKDLLGISTFEENETITKQIPTAQGGLIGMALGGRFEGRVPGDGHGMEDNVYMPIRDQRQQVGTLAVSPKEYVVDAHTMSALGNGNADEGADVMDKVVRNVREQAYGTGKQPNEISGLAALRPMMERV